jgi:hypothetical protein
VKKASLLTRWSRSTRGTLRQLAALAAFVVSLISSFLKPVGFTADESSALLKFVPAIVTVIAGLVFLGGQRRRPSKQNVPWFGITILSLIMSASAFLAYRNSIYTRTCEYDNQRIAIGSLYTPHAEAYAAEKPGISCEQLLNDFTGHAEEIWSRDSINQSRLRLEITYVIGSTLFSFCFLSLGQAIYLQEQFVQGKATKRLTRRG